MASYRFPNTPYRPIKRIQHGRVRTIEACVIHDTESPDSSQEGVWNYFATSSPDGVGAHIIIGSKSVIQCAPLLARCYHAKGVNSRMIGFELCGYAADSRAKWIAKRRQRKLAANRVAWVCYTFNLGRPTRHGNVFGHGDLPGNDHTDPGKHFPWKLFILAARRAYRNLEKSSGKRWTR